MGSAASPTRASEPGSGTVEPAVDHPDPERQFPAPTAQAWSSLELSSQPTSAVLLKSRVVLFVALHDAV